jgi:hypothetical protein
MREFTKPLLFVLALTILALLNSCNQPGATNLYDRIARLDSLKANINGEFVNFGNIQASSSMMGMRTSGSTTSYAIAFFLGNGGGTGDTLEWYSEYYLDGVGPYALLNNKKNIKGVGKLVFIEHDYQNAYIRGTFEFAAMDSTLDTVRITDGVFRVHYIGYD